MDSRGIKRKRYDVMKNDLSVELHKLTIKSGEYNTEVQATTEDFQQMLKALAQRQEELLTQSLLIQEQYGETLDVLEGRKENTPGEGSGENVVLPPSYAKDAQRYAFDSNTSLKGHVAMIKKGLEEMEAAYMESEKVLKQNMEELKARTMVLEKESAKLSAGLNTFVPYVVEDSDQDD